MGGTGCREVWRRTALLSPPFAAHLPWEKIYSTSELFNLDPFLVASIITVESAGNPYAIRYEPHYKWVLQPVTAYAEKAGVSYETELISQKTSWGIMQVMGAVCRENGYLGPLPKLTDPEEGMTQGCTVLKKLFERYDTTQDVVSAYNAGSVRRTEGGFYGNQRYVDKVYRYLRELEKIRHG